jgi:hypothetical protein
MKPKSDNVIKVHPCLTGVLQQQRRGLLKHHEDGVVIRGGCQTVLKRFQTTDGYMVKKNVEPMNTSTIEVWTDPRCLFNVIKEDFLELVEEET